MSVASLIRSVYEPDADERQGRAAVLVRMLLILLGGVVVAGIAVALVVGLVSMIWGGTIVSIVQQIAGV